MEQKPFQIWIRGSGVFVPQEMKEKETLAAIKKAIKTWNPYNCPCRLYKKYVTGIRFI